MNIHIKWKNRHWTDYSDIVALDEGPFMASTRGGFVYLENKDGVKRYIDASEIAMITIVPDEALDNAE